MVIVNGTPCTLIDEAMRSNSSNACRSSSHEDPAR